MPRASRIEVLEVDDRSTISDKFLGSRAPALLEAFCERASRLQQLAVEYPELVSYSWTYATGMEPFLVSTCKALGDISSAH